MMKKRRPPAKLLFFTLIALVALSGCACAQGARDRSEDWRFWKKPEFMPYMEPAKAPQHTQWNNDVWQPADWIAQTRRQTDMLHRFYKADIIRDQSICDGVPVLTVGPGFYRLGGNDRQRVAETVDYFYQITQSAPGGMYALRDWRTRDTIGVFTRQGLQIQ